LVKVARKAGEFAAAFGCGETAELLGVLHDIGKARREFQEYLNRLEAGERLSRGPQHSIWGAALAYWLIYKRRGEEEGWKEPCLPVAGHHGGMRSAGALALELEDYAIAHGAELRDLGVALLEAGMLPKQWGGECHGRPGTSREFRIRMLLSALTDADYLATEEHFDPERAAQRSGWPTLEELWERFAVNQAALLEGAARVPTVVNQVRREVYERCLEAAEMAPGFFRLTVPTGGGKTRSSLGFGLVHAKRQRLRRIVVAVPYTSITDQTARECRLILGEDAVVEHHSQAAWCDGESQAQEQVRARLATENWDAPVIVTTTVQLFESMFADGPGRVRKLHNLARAVIILDEAQMLPPELLRTTWEGLQTLVREYGTTVVLCTATQPALDETPYLRGCGDTPVREMVPEHERHFQVLRRVSYEVEPEPLSWEDLEARIAREQQVLLILNTRRNAMAMLEAMEGAQDVFHLSALLCGAHRKAVLEEISTRLKDGRRVRAICTQVVEAGVDLDFPVVYRAIGPLDRIVQAAGRCNREGRREEGGRVVVFEPAGGGAPRGTYRIGIELAKLLLGRRGASGLHEPGLYKEYFHGLYACADLDAKHIEEARRALDYPETAKRYKFIEETVPAVVDFQEGLEKLEAWKRKPCRETWRAVQPFVVNFFKGELGRLEDDGLIERVGEHMYLWLGKYDRVRGVVRDVRDPSDLIV
jgi:CRISPR-associated endonuclease/helicase Cas3